MEQTAGRGPEDFVFPGQEGGPLRHGNFMARSFKPAVRRLTGDESIPRSKPGGQFGHWPAEPLASLRFHDLRHTCASLLIAKGMHALAVSRFLGHSTIQITMDRYGHLFPDEQEKLAAALEDTFNEAPAASPTAPVIALGGPGGA